MVRFAALVACLGIPLAVSAQAPPPGVFSEIQTAVGPRISPALEPATMRNRVAQVDTQKITAARRGREILKLNLFDDAIVEVQIKRVRPTRTGYFISGRPKGMEWGDVRLVVNGPVMVGTVETPEGTFTIRSGGLGRHVIRQIDPSKESFECGVEEATPPPAPPLPARPENAISSANPPPAGAFSLPSPQADDRPTEDGSEIRVLVVYTPALQVEQGGAAGMSALIDLLVQSANQAFEDSGINPRLVLAHAAMVEYVARDIGADLERLIDPDDGYMDEAHALRNEYAADLVHLLTNVRGFASSGLAGGFSSESLSQESRAAFAITAVDSEKVFTHETGHMFGLSHDRYTDNTAIYPYAFGYVNKRALERGAPYTARWRTIMAYNNRCSDQGLACEWLLRFSNPDQTYKGDPLGVPADDPSTGPDGPADARLTINKIARWVGSFRSEACIDFTVSPDPQIAPVDGGEVALKVDTTPGCLWKASSHAEFLQITSGILSAGTGYVNIEVDANRTGEERSGMLTVAGQDITVRQLASHEGVCSRTSAVMQAITKAAGFTDATRCGEVTNDNLAGIISLDLRNQGLIALQAKDFEGLSDLRFLLLSSNQLTSLPAGLFEGLSSLERLALHNNRLTALPGGLFEGRFNLWRLDLSFNQLAELPAGLVAGLSNLEGLSLGFNRLSELPEGSFDDLSNLQTLDLRANRLSELPQGLFDGLSKLEYLGVTTNALTELPEGLFDDLSNLKNLELGNNQFTDLPEGIFAGLSNLEHLELGANELTSLPADVFSGLSALRVLKLDRNRLRDLSEGQFAGLSNLEWLHLETNQLSDLPADVFSGLLALGNLWLDRNQLTSLPDGIFSGLTALQSLRLPGNTVDPLPLSISLETVGESQFKAIAPTGAPFTLVVPVNVSSTGTIEGGASTVTIPVGAVESAALRVERMTGTDEAVHVDIDALPTVPSLHDGYVLEKDETLPREILPPHAMKDAALTDLAVSAGDLLPAFAVELTTYATIVENTNSSVTVTPTTRNADATVEFLNAQDGLLADADERAEGHQVSLDPGDNTIKVKVTAQDGADTRIYTLVVTRDGPAGVCGRTAEVRDEIVKLLDGIENCVEVTEDRLAGIRKLDLSGKNISTLRSGDFAGLTALEDVWLYGNRLNALPEDVFSGLAVLEKVDLFRNTLTRLPAGVFEGLVALEYLSLSGNLLDSLPPGIFSGLPSLEHLRLDANQFTEFPQDLFAGLTSLKYLNLQDNYTSNLPEGLFFGLSALERITLESLPLISLPESIFSGLTALRHISIVDTRLTSLPGGIFSGLPALEELFLYRNLMRSLPAEVFSGLTRLRALGLANNRLDALPAGMFSDLSALERLLLQDNSLSSLPAGIFSGLSSLSALDLRGNAIDPLPLSVSLEKAEESKFKAVAPTGAPFALALPVNISSTGTIEGDIDAVRIPAGEVESTSVGVTRVTGTEDAVTVNLGTLPTPPAQHQGYVLKKDGTLPRVILPGSELAPPAQVTGVEVALGVEQLEVSWEAVPDADGYTVQWKSDDEAYDEARQVVVPSGDTLSHTIADLSGGTEYTIRVLATKDNADDGLPSNEVTGIPTAQPPAQVTGVAVEPGFEELAVSWDAVSDADGYEVQWKSDEEDYDEERQAVLTGMDMVSHTIADLSGGTEYTVRVLATKDNADDGLPSNEVTGIPTAQPPAQVTGVAVELGFEELAAIMHE